MTTVQIQRSTVISLSMRSCTTAAFCVAPSTRLSGCLLPSPSIPKSHTWTRSITDVQAFDLDHRKSSCVRFGSSFRLRCSGDQDSGRNQRKFLEGGLAPPPKKVLVIATIVMLAQGVVWYRGQFWALYFRAISNRAWQTTAYIVGAGLIIGTQKLIAFGWLSDQSAQAGDIGRHAACGGHLLSAVFVFGSETRPGNRDMPIAILIIAILVHMSGWSTGRTARSSPKFPKPGPLRVGLRAVSHRQRLGWRIGAIHYYGGVPGNGQCRLCINLPDRCSRGVLRAQPVPDARNSSNENLGAGGGKGVIGNLARQAGCWAERLRIFFHYSFRTRSWRDPLAAV